MVLGVAPSLLLVPLVQKRLTPWHRVSWDLGLPSSWILVITGDSDQGEKSLEVFLIPIEKVWGLPFPGTTKVLPLLRPRGVGEMAF